MFSIFYTYVLSHVFWSKDGDTANSQYDEKIDATLMSVQ